MTSSAPEGRSPKTCESCRRLREQLDAAREDEFTMHGRALAAEAKLRRAEARVSALTGALVAADDLLRRLSEWDALNLLPVEAPYGDAPFWQREIAKTRAAVSAALPKEPDGSRAALGVVGPPTNEGSAPRREREDAREGRDA